MTDNEIIKALECNNKVLGDCIKEKCPLLTGNGCIFDDDEQIKRYALDLINRQKAEIERLEITIESLVELEDDEYD